MEIGIWGLLCHGEGELHLNGWRWRRVGGGGWPCVDESIDAKRCIRGIYDKEDVDLLVYEECCWLFSIFAI